MKYYASFCANNGTTLIEALEYTNLRLAEKEIRQMAVGETFTSSEFRWRVDDENGKMVSAGSGVKYDNGKVQYYRL